MEKLTKEEFEFLSTIKDRFDTASKADYMRSVSKDEMQKMSEIYDRLIGKHYSLNLNCGKCQLDLTKRLAPYYYEASENKSDSGTDSSGEVQEGNKSGDTEEVQNIPSNSRKGLNRSKQTNKK